MTIVLILVVAAIALGPILGAESRPDFIEHPEGGVYKRPLG